MGCGWFADRGQSTVIGYVLVVGMVVGGMTVVLVAGGAALSQLQTQADVDRAEIAMSQLDSQAGLVALGDARTQEVSLSGVDGGSFVVEPEAGRVKVFVVNETHNETIVDERLGVVRYTVGDETLAYQGGGVWYHQADRSRLVSPPEYHYRDRTLTFPVVRVTGERWSGAGSTLLTVESNGTDMHYPGETYANPLSEGHVLVRVESEYHHGWAEFFRTRTDGTVTHDPANDTVAVNLTVPFEEPFDNAVTATDGGSDAIENNGSPGGFTGPTETGATRPSASDRVDERIDDCERGNCTDLGGELPTPSLDSGRYYADTGVTIEDATYDTSGGDIDVVVDGDLAFDDAGGPPWTEDHTVTGGGTVTFYVKGDVEMTGNTQVNTDGDAGDLVVLVHSDAGDVTASSGTPGFTGLVYAPNTNLTVSGNAELDGAAVVETATANGNAELTYERSADTELTFERADEITYLHVTENRVDVTG